MMHFGIWEFDENTGIVGKPQNFPELVLSLDKLWDTEETGNGKVWKWPVNFARNSWFTPQIADDFNKAYFYAQRILKNHKPPEMHEDLAFNARTILHQTILLGDFLYGLEDEMVAE